MVVTGTQSPRQNLDASVAVTTLTAQEVEQAAPRSTTEMLRYVPGLHPGRELGRRGQPEHLDARHPRRRVRDVHGGRDAGVPHHAHLLHERRQPLPLRREHRADGGGAGRRLGALRLQHARAPSSTSSTRPAAISSPAPCGPPAAPRRYARYDLNAGGPLGEDWRFNVGGFYRYDHGVRDPGLPRHPGRPAQGQRDPAARQRLHPRVGQAHRRPQPVHPAAAVRPTPTTPTTSRASATTAR